MAITRLNSLAIPAGTVEPADISYPLTNFSSTGIDDNASNIAITIDSSGNIGIGESTPSGLLHVKKADSGASIVSGSAADLIVEGATNTGITIRTPNTSKGSLFFQDPQSTAAGYLQYDHSDDSMRIGSTGIERMRIHSSGRVGIGETSPQELLHVKGGAIVSAPVLYSSNQDQPYLIAASQNYTGANTNWGTYGIQHRIKTNSGGTPRITVDTQLAGEVFSIINGGNVGIGEANPQHTLDIQGSNVGINVDGGGTNPYIRLVEAGDTGFEISYDGASTNEFQIQSGFSGTLTSARMKIGRDTGRWENFAAGGNPTLRNTQTSSVANNGTVDFSTFSGMIIINTIGVSGDCAVWVCGSGQTTKLGSSTGTTSYTLTYVVGINGYRFTNTSGQTNTYSFMAFQTRSNA